jgi:Spy/CpxP family protein refolding chaperone
VVDDFNDAAFNEVIDKMLLSNSFDEAAIRKGAEEFYSLEKAVENYHLLYKQILFTPEIFVKPDLKL